MRDFDANGADETIPSPFLLLVLLRKKRNTIQSKRTQSWIPASLRIHESKASAGSSSAASARENDDEEEEEVDDDVDDDAPLELARSPSILGLPAIALATESASTVTPAAGGGTPTAATEGAEEEEELVVVVSVVVEGFANIVSVLLRRCPAISLAACAGACSR